jgi:spermidine synthase
MNLLGKWLSGRGGAATARVLVEDRDGVRYLYLGNRTIQSAMRLADPAFLELSYTRSMMAGLLFQPAPRFVLLIGLGGGSIARFLHERLPASRLVAVDVNPEVVAVARAQFSLPGDDDRFRVVIGDGAAFVRDCTEPVDLLLVDGYDARGQAPELATPDFYADCARAVGPNGVLVVNLWSSDRHFGTQLARIRDACPGGLLRLPARKRGNVVAIGFSGARRDLVREGLRASADAMAVRLGLEFPEFLDAIEGLHAD